MPTAQASLRAVSPWRALQLVLQLEGVEYRPKCECRTARTKPEIALAEIDRVMAAGVHFGCADSPPPDERGGTRYVRT